LRRGIGTKWDLEAFINFGSLTRSTSAFSRIQLRFSQNEVAITPANLEAGTAQEDRFFFVCFSGSIKLEGVNGLGKIP
jgi:hypothetical protein